MTTKIANGISNNPDTVLATKEALTKALNSIDNQTPDLVLIFSSTIYDLDLVLKTVKEVSKSENIVGASSSGEFTQEKAITSGIAITVIKSDSMIFEIDKANNFKNRYEEVAEQCFSSFKDDSKKMLQNGFRFPTVLILSDGLVMSRGEELIKAVYAKTGILSQFAGGGAGDDGKFKETKVLFKDEAVSGAVVFVKIFSKEKIGLGVAHGMEKCSKQMKVTKSEDGLLYELDGRPAFDVYKDYAKDSFDIELDISNTGDFFINNELAIQDLTFSKVRSPMFSNPDGSLVMAAEVPQGSPVTIVTAKTETLLKAARVAAEEAKKNQVPPIAVEQKVGWYVDHIIRLTM
ncbi:MAG: FIST signal transduction protein [Candidatus Sericytochromatia bacterium]